MLILSWPVHVNIYTYSNIKILLNNFCRFLFHISTTYFIRFMSRLFILGLVEIINIIFLEYFLIGNYQCTLIWYLNSYMHACAVSPFSFVFYTLFIYFCLHLCICGDPPVLLHMERSEENFGKSILSFYHLGFGD